MLSQTAGHADFRLPGGVDGLAAAVAFPGSPCGIVDTVDDIRTRVRVAAGADCVKLAASGGVTSPHDRPEWLDLRPELVRAAIEEAEAHGGLWVAVHAIGEPGIAAAVRAGVHSVEHGYALTDELRAEMAERGQFLVPTLLETTAEPDPARVGPHIHAKAVHWHRVAQEAFARSVAAGVPVAMGTDAGLTAPHGQNLKELGLMVRFGGMTPLQAIRTATADAARLCGVDDLTGRSPRGWPRTSSSAASTRSPTSTASPTPPTSTPSLRTVVSPSTASACWLPRPSQPHAGPSGMSVPGLLPGSVTRCDGLGCARVKRRSEAAASRGSRRRTTPLDGVMAPAALPAAFRTTGIRSNDTFAKPTHR
ncbi:amidohydrolase family protein [Streptomyces cinereoruber]|uniref:amidohydrolase family protein n=1 Tax=Streptomyces cinereoruber TaxID=67260 RepID=UPI003EBE0938